MADKAMIATRVSYGNALAKAGELNSKIVVLDADLSGSTRTNTFAKKFPDRFYNCGIAECNMMSIAAGIATTGLIPFASTFAMFASGRAFEQVRNSIGYPHLNVKICATHAGISVGEDGASHQCNEDLALMRTIPGMTVICPADDVETRAVIAAIVDYEGPCYVRLGRMSVPVIFDESNYKFEIGKSIEIVKGNDLTIIATGLMLSRALEAAETLKAEGINARVINMPTIKPLDKAAIEKAAVETGAIVTAEEHTVIGGLGSAVAEYVTEVCPVPVLKVGVNDVFGKSGPANEILPLFGLSAENVADKSRQVLKLKK